MKKGKQDKVLNEIMSDYEQKLIARVQDDFSTWFIDYREKHRAEMPTFALIAIADECLRRENARESRTDTLIIYHFAKSVPK